MVYLGLDYGEKRIGISFADELGVACPLPAATHKTEKERLEHILEVVTDRNVQAIVIGYPFNMDGSVGFKAKEVDRFVEKLEKLFDLPIYKTDERLSSHEAQMGMDALGLSKKTKSIKSKQQARQTGELDSRAAALILQDYLDSL